MRVNYDKSFSNAPNHYVNYLSYIVEQIILHKSQSPKERINMKNTKSISLLILCLVVAGCLLIVTSKNPITETSMVSAAAEPTPIQRFYGDVAPIPEEVKYFVLFQELKELNTTDATNQAQGNTTSFKNSYYTTRLTLQSSQATTVDSIITDCFTQIQPLDQRAKDVIAQYRSPYPNGGLKQPPPGSPESNAPIASGKGFESLPPIPAELGQLQAQKNQIVLNAKERIRTALGTTDFAKFDAAVKQNATRMLVPINSYPTVPRVVPTPN